MTAGLMTDKKKVLLFDEFQIVQAIVTLKDQVLLPLKKLQDDRCVHAVLAFGTYTGITLAAGNPLSAEIEKEEKEKEKESDLKDKPTFRVQFSPFQYADTVYIRPASEESITSLFLGWAREKKIEICPMVLKAIYKNNLLLILE